MCVMGWPKAAAVHVFRAPTAQKEVIWAHGKGSGTAGESRKRRTALVGMPLAISGRASRSAALLAATGLLVSRPL